MVKELELDPETPGNFMLYGLKGLHEQLLEGLNGGPLEVSDSDD